MNPRGLHLQYSFEDRGQEGAQIENPLFELLSAVQQEGSIGGAAKALKQSYRHVWGALKHWETVLGRGLVVWAKGQPARLTPFAERLLWAERQARTRMTPHVEALRSELRRVFAHADDSALQLLEVHASHDLGLPRLQALAEQRGLHLGLRFAGSVEALRRLADGRCSVAGFHVPAQAARDSVFARALRPWLRPGEHKLIGSHRRRQGLMLRPAEAQRLQAAGPGATAWLSALAARGLRFANRQPGSGTRLLMDHLLVQAGIDPGRITGQGQRTEDTHVAVAAAIAAGSADAGLGLEAAAAEFGLAFLPMAEEDYHLVVLKAALDTPAVQTLRETLASPAWAQALCAMPGYAPQQAGQVLSLTRTLPWWRGRSPRPAGPRDDEAAKHSDTSRRATLAS